MRNCYARFELCIITLKNALAHHVQHPIFRWNPKVYRRRSFVRRSRTSISRLFSRVPRLNWPLIDVWKLTAKQENSPINAIQYPSSKTFRIIREITKITLSIVTIKVLKKWCVFNKKMASLTLAEKWGEDNWTVQRFGLGQHGLSIITFLLWSVQVFGYMWLLRCCSPARRVRTANGIARGRLKTGALSCKNEFLSGSKRLSACLSAADQHRCHAEPKNLRLGLITGMNS